jgi:hypothetical protein
LTVTPQPDASGFAIAGNLIQFDGFGVLLIYSRKCTPRRAKYDTYDRELLAIVASMKQWRHPREVFPDNQGTLSRRQARWAEILSACDFKIEHLEGTKNPADRPFRWPDYEQGYERRSARLLATCTFSHLGNVQPSISLRKRRRNRA